MTADDSTFEITCNRCRGWVPADVEVCPGCGAVLIERESTDPEPVERPSFGPIHGPPALAVPVDLRAFGASVAQCEICRRRPARRLVIRRHVGMVVLMRFVRLRGTYCRDCGTRLIRAYTFRTLWQGWWGFISAFVNALTILLNLANLIKVRRLPPPERSTPPLARGLTRSS